MYLELSEQQADLLRETLRTHLDELEREISRTEKTDFRRELRGSIEQLEEIWRRLDLRSQSQGAYA